MRSNSHNRSPLQEIDPNSISPTRNINDINFDPNFDPTNDDGGDVHEDGFLQNENDVFAGLSGEDIN